MGPNQGMHGRRVILQRLRIEFLDGEPRLLAGPQNTVHDLKVLEFACRSGGSAFQAARMSAYSVGGGRGGNSRASSPVRRIGRSRKDPSVCGRKFARRYPPWALFSGIGLALIIHVTDIDEHRV